MARLAILVVYRVREDQDWLLEIHLKKIFEMTKGCDVRVFGAASRLSDGAERTLKNTPRVELVPLPATSKRGNREHSHYLDLLAEHAIQVGADYFLTLDVDSFPIAPDWFERLASQVSDERPFAAIIRKENGDVNLPHPAGLFCKGSFYAQHKPRFLPDKRNDLETKAFMDKTKQRHDTGIGFAAKADSLGLEWVGLERSNKRNHHYIMAGIYGDIFFHIGAVGRAPAFRGDWSTTLYRVQLFKEWHSLERTVSLKKRWDEERNSILQENCFAQGRIFSFLKNDHNAFLEGLKGESLSAPEKRFAEEEKSNT